MTTTRPAAFSLRSIAVPAFGPALLFSIGEGAILPVVALSARELGASVAVAALIVTLIGLGSWFFNLPASVITLKFGERWAIVGAAAASAAALVAAALAPLAPNGIWLLAASMVVVGMAASVFSLARQKYLTEAVPVTLRARALSTLGGVNRIGIFIGPFIGAAVMQFGGITAAYWTGVVAMAAAAGLSVTIPDLVAAPGPADGTAASQPTLRSVAASHAGVFLSVGLGVLLLSALRASRQVVIPLWADHLGLDATHASLIYGISGAIDMLVFYPAGKLMDRKGRQWVAVPSTLIMGTAMLLIPLSTGFVGLMLAGAADRLRQRHQLRAEHDPRRRLLAGQRTRPVSRDLEVHGRRRRHRRPGAAVRRYGRGFTRGRGRRHRRARVRRCCRLCDHHSPAQAPPQLLTAPRWDLRGEVRSWRSAGVVRPAQTTTQRRRWRGSRR